MNGWRNQTHDLLLRLRLSQPEYVEASRFWELRLDQNAGNQSCPVHQ